MNIQEPSLSLVIPTYNERSNLKALLSLLSPLCAELHAEVIIVDDDSPDRTWEAAQGLMQVYPWLRVDRRMNTRGLSAAVLRGFALARGRILGVMDADLSHDAMILPKLIQAVEDGADIAIGSRRVPGGGADHWPWFRQAASSLATAICRQALRVPIADPMSGFFCLRRSVFESCAENMNPRGYKILLELYCRSRPDNVVEIPFVFQDRRQGVSKLSWNVIQDYFLSLLTLAFHEKIQRLRIHYHYGRYRKVRSLLGPGSLLDIGCGKPCEAMEDQAFLQYVGRGEGIDIKRCDGPFPMQVASAEKIPHPNGHFDNVCALEVLEHVEDPQQALGEIERVLKEDGVAVVSVPRENWLWNIFWYFWERSFGFYWFGTHVHDHHAHARDWNRLLSKRFVIERMNRHWILDLIYRLRKKNG